MRGIGFCMKTFLKVFVFLFIQTALVNSVCAAKRLNKTIVGTWKLQSFVRITDDNTEIPWCTNPNGYFTYTNLGYMSVAINCGKDTPEDAPSRPYNNMLLYTATYKVDEEKKQVLHHVLNSSYTDFIGIDLPPRNAELSEKTLTLRGNSGKGNFKVVLEKQ